MENFIMFLIGLIIGACLGVVALAIMVQASKADETILQAVIDECKGYKDRIEEDKAYYGAVIRDLEAQIRAYKDKEQG